MVDTRKNNGVDVARNETSNSVPTPMSWRLLPRGFLPRKSGLNVEGKQKMRTLTWRKPRIDFGLFLAFICGGWVGVGSGGVSDGDGGNGASGSGNVDRHFASSTRPASPSSSKGVRGRYNVRKDLAMPFKFIPKLASPNDVSGPSSLPPSEPTFCSGTSFPSPSSTSFPFLPQFDTAEPSNGTGTRKLKFLLQKKLKASDVCSLGRIVLPKKATEKFLPPLNHKDGIFFPVEDMSGLGTWGFRFRFWPNSGGRMYLFESTWYFVEAHELAAGDYLIIYKDEESGTFYVRARKSTEDPDCESKKSERRKKAPAPPDVEIRYPNCNPWSFTEEMDINATVLVQEQILEELPFAGDDLLKERGNFDDFDFPMFDDFI